MVFNKDGNVFCGQRLDNKAEAWQLPQGGIDEGELPIEAGFRELKEETSIINVEFLCEFPEWINYDIPLPLADNSGVVNIEVNHKDGCYFIFLVKIMK
jgi:putative (di)nucleoside polyphosphate hydrolase